MATNKKPTVLTLDKEIEEIDSVTEITVNGRGKLVENEHRGFVVMPMKNSNYPDVDYYEIRGKE